MNEQNKAGMPVTPFLRATPRTNKSAAETRRSNEAGILHNIALANFPRFCYYEMEVSGMNQLSDQAKEELLHALEGKQSDPSLLRANWFPWKWRTLSRSRKIIPT